MKNGENTKFKFLSPPPKRLRRQQQGGKGGGKGKGDIYKKKFVVVMVHSFHKDCS